MEGLDIGKKGLLCSLPSVRPNGVFMLCVISNKICGLRRLSCEASLGLVVGNFAFFI